VARRRLARELEALAAARRPATLAARAPVVEPLAMLRRRGLDPRRSRLDLAFDPRLPEAQLDAIAARLGHYAFRLFLRGAILARGDFTPAQATRYVVAEKARRMAEECVDLGIAERRPGDRFRLLHPARSFGGTLEWWLARELATRLGLETVAGVRSGAPGVGGDLDVVAACEGKLVYLEVKSSPPKHVKPSELSAFLRRLDALRPDVALFVVDTALRLADKLLPLFGEAFTRAGQAAPPPHRIVRETWALGPHLYVVGAKEDLVENLCRAIAEGLRALAPFPYPPRSEPPCPTST